MNEASVTQSQMADRSLTICHSHRVPTPRTPHRIGAETPDVAWPQQRLVVETDSRLER
jgi:hypothetical protein